MLVVGLVLPVASANACISPLFDPRTEFKAVDSVVLGKVIEYDGKFGTFGVLRAFKGNEVGQIRVRTVEYEESCGYGWALAKDTEHPVYAAVDDSGYLRTST